MATPMISVSTRGPVFTNGQEAAIVRQFLEEAQDEVGAQALSNVQTILNVSIRNPTPYYETQIIKERAMNDVVVHDRGIIYGPWLEGTGSRNATTSFKGYHAFRNAAQVTRGEVGRIVLAVMRRYIGRM